MSETEKQNYIKIYTASNNAEADIIKSFLEEQGINVFIQGYHHRSLLGFQGPFIPLNLYVPKELAKQAAQMMGECSLEHFKSDAPESHSAVSSKIVRPRSIRVACILAFICPGFGTWYAGRTIIGILISFYITIVFLYFFLWGIDKTDPVILIFLISIPLLILIDAILASLYIYKKRKS